MHLTSNELRTIKEFFNEQPVLKAYLYGSYARKEAGKESDVNIMVELDAVDESQPCFAKMKIDLQKIIHKKIDLVSSSDVSKYILPFIEHDKKLLYKKG